MSTAFSRSSSGDKIDDGLPQLHSDEHIAQSRAEFQMDQLLSLIHI